MKQLFQFRYYGADDSKNYPVDTSKWTDNILQGIKSYDVSIQSLPGISFSFNQGESIVLGITGLFEIPFQQSGEIVSLRFESDILDKIDKFNNGYLMVDILGEEVPR